MMSTPTTKDIEMVARLSRLVVDGDVFTLAYDLAHRTNPVGLTNLSREYGADPAIVKDLLDMLIGAGIVTMRGRAYLATPRVPAAMRALKDAFKNAPRDADRASSSSTPMICLSGATRTETNNGQWTSMSTRFLITSSSIVSNKNQEEPASERAYSAVAVAKNSETSEVGEIHAPRDYAHL
jgi:hypothetical protein